MIYALCEVVNCTLSVFITLLLTAFVTSFFHFSSILFPFALSPSCAYVYSSPQMCSNTSAAFHVFFVFLCRCCSNLHVSVELLTDISAYLTVACTVLCSPRGCKHGGPISFLRSLHSPLHLFSALLVPPALLWLFTFLFLLPIFASAYRFFYPFSSYLPFFSWTNAGHIGDLTTAYSQGKLLTILPHKY